MNNFEIHNCEEMKKYYIGIDIFYDDGWILETDSGDPISGVSFEISFCPFCGEELSNE